MDLNDGKGLYDKYGLIDSIITDLDRLTVSGAQNMVIVINSINRLGALRDGLKKEDADDHHDEQGQDL